MLGGWDPSQGQGHYGRGQREQHRGQRERGGGAQQLAADPAQRLGRAERPLDPLYRVGGGGGEPRRGTGGGENHPLRCRFSITVITVVYASGRSLRRSSSTSRTRAGLPQSHSRSMITAFSSPS